MHHFYEAMCQVWKMMKLDEAPDFYPPNTGVTDADSLLEWDSSSCPSSYQVLCGPLPQLIQNWIQTQPYILFLTPPPYLHLPRKQTLPPHNGVIMVVIFGPTLSLSWKLVQMWPFGPRHIQIQGECLAESAWGQAGFHE